VRYRVLFPTSIQNGRAFHEIPFGAIERTQGIEYPAQNWIDYSDNRHGIALLNRGLPGNNVESGTLLLSLLRSSKLLQYPSVGGFDPTISSDSGLQLGKTLRLQYALVPHEGSWQQSGIFREGFELNHPLIVRKTTSHAGTLPKRWGLLEVSNPAVVISALKPGADGGTILRVYEATGKEARDVRIEVHQPLVSASEVNLMEDVQRPLPVQGAGIQFNLRGHEIKTFNLKIKPLKKV